MPIPQNERTASLVIVASIALCCIGFLTFEWVGARFADRSYTHIRESLEPGMSRAQVLAVFNREGTYTIHPQKPFNCTHGAEVPSQVELVFLYPALWHHHSVGLWLCYDDSWLLTNFYLFD